MTEKKDKVQCDNCGRWIYEREGNWVEGNCRYCKDD